MSQTELAGNTITRNMLSVIESGKANPSLDSITHIAKALDVPVSYLMAEDDDLYYYRKKEMLGAVKELFAAKKYKSCIDRINDIGGLDDELHYILALCYFELGKSAVLGGSLSSGKKHLDAFNRHRKETVYDTSLQYNSSLLYSALAENIQSPLLELDTALFEKNVCEGFEYDFYKYLLSDQTHEQKNPMFKAHLNARQLIKERKYKDALSVLLQMLENKAQGSYNAYLIFALYADIESCYKQLLDFENAYRYASKRLSIIEGFKL